MKLKCYIHVCNFKWKVKRKKKKVIGFLEICRQDGWLWIEYQVRFFFFLKIIIKLESTSSCAWNLFFVNSTTFTKCQVQAKWISMVQTHFILRRLYIVSICDFWGQGLGGVKTHFLIVVRVMVHVSLTSWSIFVSGQKHVQWFYKFGNQQLRKWFIPKLDNLYELQIVTTSSNTYPFCINRERPWVQTSLDFWRPILFENLDKSCKNIR